MRKILAVILSIAMVISFIPTTAFAAYADSGTVFIMTDHFEMGKKYLIVNGNDGDVETLANSKNDLFTTESVIVSNDEITYSGNGLSVWEAKTATNNKIGLFNNGTVLKINAQNSPKITTKEAKYNSGGFEYTQNCHVSYPYSNILYYIGSDNNSFKASKSENDLGMVYIFVEKEGGSSTQSGTGGTVEIEATKTTATEKSATIAVGEKLTIEVSHTSGESKNFTNTISNGEKAEILSGATLTGLSKNAKGSVVVQGLANGSADVTLTGASPSGQGSEYKAIIHLTVVTGGTTPVTPPSDGTVKVGFTSDVHGETANLENWLKKLPVKLDNMCFCGDYSYSYDQSKYKSDYDKVVDLTERYIGTGRGIYTAGNHEYQNGNNLNVYSGIKRLGEAAVSTNAYKVYCLGAYRFDGIGEFQSSDYTALDDYLKGVSPTTPVFILSHFPLHYIQSRTITNAKAVIDVLNKYPNAVFMWGHNHSQNGESHYGEVKSFGESIQYNSTQSATISFTYACAGAMNDSQGKYDGCVASVKGDEVTLSYYDADGSQPNIKGKSSTSFKVDISEWSAQQGTDPQPSGDTIENGKYIIVANGKALTTSAGAGYSNGSGSESYTYSGLSGKDYTNGATAVTSDMIWDIQKSGNGYTIKNGNNFLNGTYSNNKGVLKLDSTQDIWTYSENRLTSTNSNKQLEYGNSGGTASTIFTMRSTGSDITLYKYSSGSTSTDPASVTVPVAATNLVYNGSLQTGVAAGTGYTLAGNTATNAGNYTATATLAEGYKWSDNTTVPKTISWSISKATPTITSPSASAITSGQALNNSTLSGGQAKLGDVAVNGTFTWKNGATIPALTDSEKTEYDVTFTPNDNTNYNSAECKVKVKVNNSALTGLTITQAPGKVIYTVGDKFDSKEMIVKANYADGSSAVITNYTVTPDRELKLSDKSVTVSYKEGNITMTVAQAITVNEMETVATPALPAATVFLDKKYITITCATEGAVIYYTVDGTTPTADSTKYTGSFLIGETTTVKALAVKEGMNNSAIASASYTRGMPFTDVSQSDWFYNDVYYVYINGIMEGTGATIFNPNLFTTRAMIVTMLYRLENEPAVGGTNPFGDVTNGKWYTEAIKWAYKNKIVEGYTPTQFGPNDTITREQLAAILYRYAKYKGYDLSAGESTNILSFTDANKVSSYAVTAVQWAVGEGLINGVTPTTLSPKTGATRAQVAAILHRFCENVK